MRKALLIVAIVALALVPLGAYALIAHSPARAEVRANAVLQARQDLTAQQQAGRDLYFGRATDVVTNCNGCHTLDPSHHIPRMSSRWSVASLVLMILLGDRCQC